jgi:hypothetical protein
MIHTFLSAFLLFLIPITIGWFAMGKPKTQHLFILALAAGISYMIWRFQSPFPYPLNWDMWEHQTAVNAILTGHVALLPSALSDTFGFNGYTTLFHYILALPQYLFSPDILGFWWIAEVYMAFVTSMAAYALTRAITKRDDTALVAGVLSALCFESSIVFTPFFLMPQTAAAVIWCMGFAWIMSVKRFPNIVGLLVLSLALFSMHFVIGTAGILTYLVYLIIRFTRVQKGSKGMRFTLYTMPLWVYAIAFGLSRYIPMGTINWGEAANFIQTIPEKLTDMQGWYGYFPLFLVPIGMVALNRDPKASHAQTIAIISLTVLAVVFSPIAYSMKFYALGRYFVIMYVACGVMYFIDQAVIPKYKTGILFLFFAAQLVIFTTNVLRWQESLQFQGVASHVSTHDVELATFLKKNYGNTRVMLISDPTTSYILEPLTGINTPGGAYMNSENRIRIASLINASDSARLSGSLQQIHDKLDTAPVSGYVLILSARYFQWTNLLEAKQLGFAFNIWRPQAMTLADTIAVAAFEKTMNVQPVFTNASGAVFYIPRTGL